MSAEDLRPFLKYRPVKTSDGEGGVTEALGNPSTVYAKVEVYKEQLTVICRRETDVKVKDILILNTADFSG